MRKYNAAILMALLVLLGSVSLSTAAEITDAKCSLNVVPIIELDKVTEIDFGNIYKAENETCTMAFDTGVLTGGGCGSDTGTPATFTISGLTGSTLAIELVAPPTVDGVTFTPALSNGGLTDTFSLTVSPMNFNVGGEITTGGTVAADGPTEFQYTVKVNYN